MATLWRRTMLMLGLGPDDEYDDDPHDAPGREARSFGPAAGGTGQVTPVATAHPPAAEGPSSMLGPVRAVPRPETEGATVTPVRPGVVRPVSAPVTAKVVTVAPTTFNDAQEVADKYMSGQPVIVNLQDVERDVSRRLVDFASGLCYGLRGQMKQVANRVYLLTPADVEVSAEDKRRLQERGLYRA